MICVLYHGSCYDGFGAAWAAYRVYGDRADYRACTYNEGDAPLQETVEKGYTEVFVVDFSFSREALLDAHSKLHHLRVYDHHQTAQAALEGLDFCVFDMKRSGALITWEEMHPDLPAPSLIQYISDRDLWKFELPNSKAHHVALQCFPFDFKVWDQLAKERPGYLTDMGIPILKHQEQLVEIMAKKAVKVEVAGIKLAICNATVYFSEVPHRILELNPDCQLAAYFSEVHNQKDGWSRVWGVRGRDSDSHNAAEFAKKFGGGGHFKAAGFRTVTKGSPVEDLLRGLKND